MKAVGVLQPINVRIQADGTYTVISGERRLRAAKAASLGTIPAVIRSADWAVDARVAAIAENVARADLSPIEEASSYRELMAATKLKASKIGPMVGRSSRHVTERLKLLELPEVAQAGVHAGTLPLKAVDNLLAVTKVSAAVAEGLAEFAALSPQHATEVSDRLNVAVGDLNKELRAAKGDGFEEVCVVAVPSYHGTNLVRHWMTDETAARIEALPEGLRYRSTQFGRDDLDAAQAYGCALIFKTHDNDPGRGYITDPTWLADRILHKTEEAEKLAEKQSADAKERHGNNVEGDRLGAAEQAERRAEQFKAQRAEDKAYAGRAHERNVAIGRNLLRKKHKLDTNLTKLLCLLALDNCKNTAGHAWSFVDERFCEPITKTRKDGGTDFKLNFLVTPHQAQVQLQELVAEAKTADEALRLTLGALIAAEVIDARSTAASNRPGKGAVSSYKVGDELAEALEAYAKQFDLPIEYDGESDEEPPAEPTTPVTPDLGLEPAGEVDDLTEQAAA